MLQRLGAHIEACYERAGKAEELATGAVADSKNYYLQMAMWWSQLARNYEFVESLERFLLDLEAGAAKGRSDDEQPIWRPISTAPSDRDLRLAVLDADGTAHALIFPCRQIEGGWVKADTKTRIQLEPTHWREWGSADNAE